MPKNALVTAEHDLRRFQESLIPSFNEIAETFLSTAPGDGTDLQKYLDGTVEVYGIRYRRRTVLLTIHDMKHERAAPQTLQSATLAYLTLLNVQPIPPLCNYQDIATALLRMEIVIRLGTLIGPEGVSITQAGWQGQGPDAAGPRPTA